MQEFYKLFHDMQSKLRSGQLTYQEKADASKAIKKYKEKYMRFKTKYDEMDDTEEIHKPKV